MTVWQIFNSGSIPLGKHSNEELLNRYMKIQEQLNCLDGNMTANIPTLGWFPIKLDIPKQNELTVNKKIQKLVNYTITDHLNDQVTYYCPRRALICTDTRYIQSSLLYDGFT